MPNPFDVVPDPISKAAMEEAFIPSACKAVLGEYTPPPGMNNPNPGFPPELAEILSISAVYLRAGASGGIKQEFIALSSTLPPTGSAVRLHRQSIDARHDAMPDLLNITRNIPVLSSKRNPKILY